MRVLFALPGLHRYNRGAELAFISVAKELVRLGDTVTLIGSGSRDSDAPYRFLHAPSIRRERFESSPSIPVLRNEYAYEEMTFAPALAWRYRPKEYDVTLTCSYPFTNWVLRRPLFKNARPPHVFVTQNGDWPATAKNSEYRFFGCEGLICTNPQFYERNKDRWRSSFIPNGVDCGRFNPGPSLRQHFGLPSDRPIVLMVSALIPSKRVAVGIEAVSRISNVHLAVAGDGPLRHQIESMANELLPGRFTRLSVKPEMMPSLYRSADVFMHLSKDEPSSLAFLEALATGLPVVAHRLPQLEYIVGDDGYLVDTDDLESVTRQIGIATQSLSNGIQRRLKRADEFSWQRIAARYRAFLQEVVSSQ